MAKVPTARSDHRSLAPRNGSRSRRRGRGPLGGPSAVCLGAQ